MSDEYEKAPEGMQQGRSRELLRIFTTSSICFAATAALSGACAFASGVVFPKHVPAPIQENAEAVENVGQSEMEQENSSSDVKLLQATATENNGEGSPNAPAEEKSPPPNRNRYSQTAPRVLPTTRKYRCTV